ncbi:hypothetical protein BDQ94DRAFT_144944 [Aspergillus welwitschiae]|uniref:Uncharacterized protein n=1 Tax=Aspergillus welwitschiae TaxID=1341132 RepID=A0A3F3Q177_9EURO|nr:hypothetical protein BDQ94DRAFT_144944 [Aspergillus welwitschiae]RDH32742.1 hypothetical protein BDQ94DRAFT_144944 [Aspergillus welwitschiae]
MRQIQHPSLDQTGVVPGGPQTVTRDTKLKIPASSIDISRPSAESNTKPTKEKPKKINITKSHSGQKSKTAALRLADPHLSVFRMRPVHLVR